MPYTKPVRKRILRANGSNPSLSILLVGAGGLASLVLGSSDNPGDTSTPKLEGVLLGEGQRVRKSKGGERKDRRKGRSMSRVRVGEDKG